ncbi:MAG: shikimate kinase [Clostridia bacterium]|nr:shikimate kinase [Clostridia bacterium]
MLDRHIFIIGMPGCGKSSLGRKVASTMGLPYVDTDARIEQAAGCPVTQIFEKYGETAFRAAETNVLIQLTREPGSLVSTGGGMVMRPENLAIMRNHGIILLVDRPLEEIMGDIKLNRRPMLAAKGLPEVERLYHERIDVYRAAADVVLDNGHGYYAGLAGMEKIIRRHFNLNSTGRKEP